MICEECGIEHSLDITCPFLTKRLLRRQVERWKTIYEKPKFFAGCDGKFVPCRADGTEITLPEPTPDTTGWFKRWLDSQGPGC